MLDWSDHHQVIFLAAALHEGSCSFWHRESVLSKYDLAPTNYGLPGRNQVDCCFWHMKNTHQKYALNIAIELDGELHICFTQSCCLLPIDNGERWQLCWVPHCLLGTALWHFRTCSWGRAVCLVSGVWMFLSPLPVTAVCSCLWFGTEAIWVEDLG